MSIKLTPIPPPVQPALATAPKQLSGEKPTVRIVGGDVTVQVPNRHGGTIGYYPAESYLRLVRQLSEPSIDDWA